VFASFFQAQVPLAQASVTMTPIVINANGSITCSGVYGANPGWATTNLQLFILENSPGPKYLVLTNCVPNVGSWTATSQALPTGSYSVWVFHNVKNGALLQTVTTAIQFVQIPANNVAPLPNPDMRITWANGKPARNNNGFMVGDGNAIYPKGTDFDAAINPNFAMFCFPAAGGVVSISLAVLGNPLPSSWTSSSMWPLPANAKYHVLTVAHSKKTPLVGLPSFQIATSELKLNQ
jgi:hypothetical protein